MKKMAGMATLNDLLSFLQGASNSAASTVSAPVDGINWILKKAGFPVSDKPVGGSDWLKDKGLMADPKNQNLGYVGEAIGGVLPMVAAAKAPQIASALNQMGANMAAPRTLNPQTGAIVWHGSPHKFDKFDSSKIGTGEGSQAYGHGLYLAESPAVARQYQEALAGGGIVKKDGTKLIPQVGHQANALRVLKDNDYNFEAAIGQLQKPLSGLDDGWGVFASGADKHRADQLKFLEELRAGGAKFDSPGALYKVDLPDEHIAKMLDWDKPLSQQPANIQQWLKDPYNAYRHKLTSSDVGGNEPTGGLVMNRLQELMAEGKKADAFSNSANYGDANAARELRDYGIPGIRYLDGGSRGTGAGTSNFVIFPGNENLLRILERNGIPLD